MINIFKERLNGTTRELSRIVKAYADADKFAGTVLVAKGGDVLLTQASGWANRDHMVKNSAETAYRIGSMTKPFTALAIMRLAELGAISVEDTVSAFVPDFPNGERITLHHLLSNTSGILDYIVMPSYAAIMRNAVTYADLLALFRDEPLKFEPGTESGYSNSNWILLGMVIEKVMGKRYADAIHDLVFVPSGMTHSGYEWETPLIPHRAVGYYDTGEGMFNALVVHESTMDAAGALYSTVGDLYKWDQALRAGKIVDRATFDRMIQPIKPGYGYGWELYTLHDRRVIAHSGGIPGFVANFAQIEDATIIMLSNLGSAAFSDMTHDLAAALFDKPYTLPTKQTFITLDPAVLTPYLGEYRLEYFGRVSTLKFVVENGKLVMYVAGLPKSVMSPLSETRFYGRSKGEVDMTFVRESDGSIKRIDVIWAGHALQATRIS